MLQRFNEVPLPGWAGGPGRGPGRPDAYGYQCQPTPFSGPSSWPAPGSRDDWYGRGDDDYRDNGSYGSNNPPPPPAGGSGSYPGGNGGYSNGSGNYPGGNGGYGNDGYGSNYRHLLTAQETDQLIQAVRARSFDEQKVTLARQALAESDIRSEDLRRLLTGIDFDRGRLELAKFAYARVADRQNLPHLRGVFL